MNRDKLVQRIAYEIVKYISSMKTEEKVDTDFLERIIEYELKQYVMLPNGYFGGLIA